MAVDAHLYDSLQRRLGTLTAELESFRRRHDVGGGTSAWEPDDDALLAFHSGPLGYAIPAATVREVVLLATFTAVPGSPSWLLGLLDLPGEPVPVLDVSTRLKGATRPFSLEDSILIVETSRGLLGLLVEGVPHLLRVDAHFVESPLPDTAAAGYVLARARARGETWTVLDAAALATGAVRPPMQTLVDPHA